MPPPFDSVDGAGKAARLYSPTGLAATSSGQVYVTDSLNHTLRVIEPNGMVTTLAGAARQAGHADGSGAEARFALPSGVVIAGDMLYVADRLNHTVRRVTFGGTVTTFAGKNGVSGTADGSRTEARFNDPTDLRADTAGNLYVVDRMNHVIRKITPSGSVSIFAGRAGVRGTADGIGTAARFDAPDGLAIDGVGNLYVADTNNHVIRRIASDGSVTTFAGSAGQPGSVDGRGAAARFRLPNRLTVLSDGRLLVSDTGNDCLRLVSTQGDVTLYAGAPESPGAIDGSRTRARFFGPTGVAQLPDGFVLADSFNHSIRKIGPNDQVTLLAGAGGNFGSVDGPARVARFNRPEGIAAHASGDLYVTDTQGHAIRRIAPDGTVATIARGVEGEPSRDGPAGVGTVYAPHGLVVAPDRTIYFCEQQRHTVRVVSPDGHVSTLAGVSGEAGEADGAGASARFDLPSAIARDPTGNLYIADAGNHTIRRIAAGGNVVSTFAGQAGTAGMSDGVATAARFSVPQGIAVDGAGVVYVSDTGNHAIRRIAASGDVTTLAGFPGMHGYSDGTGSSARFWSPTGLACDTDGRVYVADTYNQAVRRIANRVVSTLGGRVGVPHFREGVGTDAFFFLPNGIAIDASGGVYVVQHGNNLVMKGVVNGPPSIMVQPQSFAVQTGASATFSVTAGGAGLSYQWKFNGAPIPSATASSWTVPNAQPAAAGKYSVEITNSAGSTNSAVVELTVTPPPSLARIVNLSVLSPIAAAADPFTIGFVVGGSGTTGPKPLVIRAAGPSLAAFGVDDSLVDPRLELFTGDIKAGENDDWGGTTELARAMAAVGAFPYAESTSLDAAAFATVPITAGTPISNTVRVMAKGSTGGRVLAEIYDATPEESVTTATPRLINVAVSKEVGAGVTAGFVIRGGSAMRVLIRGIGPGLAGFGIASGFLADPRIALYRGTTELGSNDNWVPAAAAAFEAVGAFALTPGSRDAAMVETLPAGDYTVTVSGPGGAGGIVLVEVYEVP